MLQTIRRRWLCLVLLLVLVLDLAVVDPLPFLDEAVLAGLTGACFGRHKRGGGDGDPARG